MYSQVKSGSLFGLASEIVIVETDLSPGLPALTVVGLPDISVRESKERIRAAIINAGYKFPAKRITINLAPAGIKKEGTHFDLPIAVGILASIGIIPEEDVEEYAFLGELSLDGHIIGFHGALPLVIGLRNQGIRKIILPAANAEEASVVGDVMIYSVKHLTEIVDFFTDESSLKPYIKPVHNSPKDHIYTEDFSEVAGQDTVKRTLQLAAAAAHNVFLL
jgi:magnesium chelatase family protein